ncbi:MAG TPA: hypothetical protein VJN21_08885 [Candidatus Acidoferrales bacterium]|nr:hypothetical protein [Candidatus Acidoferrales bacterium]
MKSILPFRALRCLNLESGDKHEQLAERYKSFGELAITRKGIEKLCGLTETTGYVAFFELSKIPDVALRILLAFR